MLTFLNNWITQLTTDLSADAQTMTMGSEADQLIPGNDYLLTLTSSTDPLKAAPHEIVALRFGGTEMYIQRGIEGTTPRDWPVGTLVYCSITAGFMNSVYQLLFQLDGRVRALERASGGGGGGGEDPPV